jgi:hypothetical protein
MDIRVSLFDRLPAELIVAIFEGARPEHVDDPVRFPMWLADVCRRWNLVVNAAPGLWTDVRIRGVGADRFTVLNDAMLCLRRSGSRPMSLKWNHEYWNHDLGKYTILPAGSDRWSHITIFTESPRLRDRLLVAIDGWSFPSLEELRWATPNEPRSIRNPVTPCFTIDAPNLRYCSLINVVASVASGPPLTTLDFKILGRSTSPTAIELSNFLGTISSTLKYLRFETQRTYLNRWPDFPIIEFPALEVLQLLCTFDLLPFLSTPNLRSISLNAKLYRVHPSLPNVIAPNLTSMDLVGFQLGNLPLEFPFLFPKLKTVSLWSCIASDVFFHQAPHRSSGNPGSRSFPSLRSIAFTDPHALPAIKSMLEDWISIDPHGSTLLHVRFLTLNDSDPLKREDVEWVTAQGVEFSVGPALTNPWHEPEFSRDWTSEMFYECKSLYGF